MDITHLQVSGYRSLQDIEVTLGGLTVIVGPNGSGKTNLYRALFLLCAAANGALARALADEGGMPSALWAGDQRKGPVRMGVRVRLDGFEYGLECGLPIPGRIEFILDPVVKEETLTIPSRRSRAVLMERRSASAWAKDAQGAPASFAFQLLTTESVLSQIKEPHRFPALAGVRETIAAWRFYHHFRTDAGSPMRRQQAGFQTPVLAHDGADLAAALQTILEIGDGRALLAHCGAAFPGCELRIQAEKGRFEVQMEVPGVHRRLAARELSDGTLRYLCLAAALMSPRPAPTLVLNEPETSLHEALLPSLARLIAEASRRSQVVVTTHSHILVQHGPSHGSPQPPPPTRRRRGAARPAAPAWADARFPWRIPARRPAAGGGRGGAAPR